VKGTADLSSTTGARAATTGEEGNPTPFASSRARIRRGSQDDEGPGKEGFHLPSNPLEGIK